MNLWPQFSAYGRALIAMTLGILCAAGSGFAAAAVPTTKTSTVQDSTSHFDASYWRDRERGWFWYDDPLPEPKPKPKPKAQAAPAAPASAVPQKPAELVRFEALQKQVEDLRNIAIINPTETNIRNYLEIQAAVIDKASTFADVAQRVIWATPSLDPTVTGRPVNAKALEVYDRQQGDARVNTVARLAASHVMLFFFRSDCPYCHQFAPLLRDFEAKFGLKVVAISVDGGGIPPFPNHRTDNGIAQTLDVRQVPALFLADPRGGKIMPIGYGVLAESDLLERIHVVSQPEAAKVVPSAAKVVPGMGIIQ